MEEIEDAKYTPSGTEIPDLKNKLSDLELEERERVEYQRVLDVMGEYEGVDRVVHIKEAIDLLKDDSGALSLDTQIQSLDKLIGGFKEGQLVILSGPTGHGKTSFARTLTVNFKRQNVDSIWFSYEEGVREFVKKFDLKKEKVPQFFLPKTLKQNSIEWLESRIIESKSKFNTKVVFIDHLHYLIDMEQMAKTRSISLLVGVLLRDLKMMARKHELIIFLVSHMRKLNYNTVPEIDDLRDSSFIGQESDYVLFIIRRMVEGNFTNEVMVKVAKNRPVGNIGMVKLLFVNNMHLEITDNYNDTTTN